MSDTFFTRFFGPGPPTDAGGGEVAYEVASGITCIIKQVIMVNTTASDAQVRIGVMGVADADLVCFAPVPGLSTLTLDVTIPVFEFEEIWVGQATADAITLTVSGVCEGMVTS